MSSTRVLVTCFRECSAFLDFQGLVAGAFMGNARCD